MFCQFVYDMIYGSLMNTTLIWPAIWILLYAMKIFSTLCIDVCMQIVFMNASKYRHEFTVIDQIYYDQVNFV